jgi:hypothetical protein
VYRIAVDSRDPYWVYAGLQDNHSWMGPSATRHWLGILNQDWVESASATARAKPSTRRLAEGVFLVEQRQPVAGRSRDRRRDGHHPRPPAGEPNYRFDWDAPVMASRHTSGTVYLGGNRLFISRDFGSTWTRTKT